MKFLIRLRSPMDRPWAWPYWAGVDRYEYRDNWVSKGFAKWLTKTAADRNLTRMRRRHYDVIVEKA